MIQFAQGISGSFDGNNADAKYVAFASIASNLLRVFTVLECYLHTENPKCLDTILIDTIDLHDFDWIEDLTTNINLLNLSEAVSPLVKKTEGAIKAEEYGLGEKINFSSPSKNKVTKNVKKQHQEDPFDDIKPPPGMIIQDAGGDGDCLYKSVGKLIDIEFSDLRRKVADYFRHNNGKWQGLHGPVDVRDTITNFEEWVNNIEKPGGEWGDEYTLVGLVNIFPQIQFHIHRPHPQISTYIGTGYITIHLALANAHYRLIRPS